MEVTLGQIYASFNLLNRIVDQTLPIRLAYRFTRLIRELNTEYQALEKLRDGLVKKYGSEVEGQEGAFKVSDDNREAFMTDFQDLLQETVEIGWELVSVEADGFDSLSLTVRELNILGWLFTEFKDMADEAAAEVTAEAIAEELTDEETEQDTDDAEVEAATAPTEATAEVG